MPNLNTAQFTLTGATTKRSLKDRLDERCLSVKDFGATGNGTTDDTAAIQAAINYCYGSFAAPHGEPGIIDPGEPDTWSFGNAMYTNKVLHFPAGNYKISAPLELAVGYGPMFVGAGSRCTRLFWSGSRVAASVSGIYPLLVFYTCWHVHIEGMTLDAGGVQDDCLRSTNWPTFTGSYANDGHDGYYYDVHFTNPCNTATSGSGHLAYGVAMGSERTYVNCRFSLCRFGVRLAQANALNHQFINCEFFDNYTGYDEVTGGAGSFTNCWFSNNSVVDIHGQQNQFHIENCYSTSKNFCSVDGVITGCVHDHPSAGMFWTSLIATIPGDTGASGWYTGTDTEKVAFTGNRSTNGTLSCSTSANASLILKGNNFASTSYRTGVPATALLWEDGVQISP